MKKKQVRTLFFLLFIIAACNKLKASEENSLGHARRNAMELTAGRGDLLSQYAKTGQEEVDLKNQIKKAKKEGRDPREYEKKLAKLLQEQAALQKKFEERVAQANIQQKKS